MMALSVTDSSQIFTSSH